MRITRLDFSVILKTVYFNFLLMMWFTDADASYNQNRWFVRLTKKWIVIFDFNFARCLILTPLQSIHLIIVMFLTNNSQSNTFLNHEPFQRLRVFGALAVRCWELTSNTNWCINISMVFSPRGNSTKTSWQRQRN